MKLKKLQIKKYKNLIDFTVDFESGKGLSILIGNNGSGKSNVLEAISGIFVNAYSAKAIHKFVYSLTYDYFLLSCGLLFASIFRIKNMTAWRYTMQSYLNSVFILFSHMARRIIPAMKTALRQYLERHPSESLCRPAW